MIVDLQSFSVVDDHSFRDLIAEAMPGYALSSRTLLSQIIVLRLYDNTRIKVQKELRVEYQDGVEGISFTSDMWSSHANETNISLTCHFLGAAFYSKCYHLNTDFSDKYARANIASAFNILVTEWGITTDTCAVYIITNNAYNMARSL